MNDSLTDLAWAAGFLDGEGCFSLSKRSDLKDSSSRMVSISASQKKRGPLDKLSSIFGGKVRSFEQDGRPCFQWSITGAERVKNAVVSLSPYLCNKRQEAMVVAAYCDTVYRRGRRPIPQHEEDIRTQLIHEHAEARRAA